jgi:hypothetical protein
MNSFTLKASSPSTGHSESIGEGVTDLGNVDVYQSRLHNIAEDCYQSEKC